VETFVFLKGFDDVAIGGELLAIQPEAAAIQIFPAVEKGASNRYIDERWNCIAGLEGQELLGVFAYRDFASLETDLRRNLGKIEIPLECNSWPRDPDLSSGKNQKTRSELPCKTYWLGQVSRYDLRVAAEAWLQNHSGTPYSSVQNAAVAAILDVCRINLGIDCDETGEGCESRDASCQGH